MKIINDPNHWSFPVGLTLVLGVVSYVAFRLLGW